MINSQQSLTAKIKEIANNNDVNYNIALTIYIFDKFVARLSQSKYVDNFVIKGGFFLCSILGLKNRTTMDIDAEIVSANFTMKNIKDMVEKIAKIDLNDNITYHIKNICENRSQDEYGGYRITIGYNVFKIKNTFHLDVATGDSIFPGPVVHEYTGLDGNCYRTYVYPIETFLAEKIETILRTMEVNSRMKDYYDIYIIYKTKHATLDKCNFKKAIKQTFRRCEFNSDEYECLNVIKNSSTLAKRWQGYSTKNLYARNINFEDTVLCLKKLIDLYKN